MPTILRLLSMPAAPRHGRRLSDDRMIRPEWVPRSQHTPEAARQSVRVHKQESARLAIVTELTEPCWLATGARQQWAGRRLWLVKGRGRSQPISAALPPLTHLLILSLYLSHIHTHTTLSPILRVCLLTRISFVGKNNSSLSQVYPALRFLVSNNLWAQF